MSNQEKYIQGLGDMIRCETISDIASQNLDKFTVLQNKMRELFPHLFDTAELELFDGSMLLRWKGTNNELDPICLMNHQDVVEATGNWDHDPFKAEIADGKMYGRGVLDDKGGLYCMLEAAEELIEEGFTPERDIYFEAACNEEINGRGCQTIVEELKKRGIHFHFTLDEGGMIVDEPIQGVKGKWAMIAVGEKGTCDLKFIARSKGGHASTPGKNTPLVRLGKFMAAMDHSSVFKLEMNDVIKEMFLRLSTSMSGPLGKVAGKVDKLEPILTHVAPAFSSTLNAFLRTTLAFTEAKGSDGYNVLPQEAYVVGNMRFSHHQGQEKSIAAVKKFAKKYDIETEVIDYGVSSNIADFRGEPFKLVEQAIGEIFPDVKCAPYLMTGASDSRFMDAICENCIRFTPFIVDGAQVGTIHGLNENVDVSCLEPAVQFYKYIIRKG